MVMFPKPSRTARKKRENKQQSEREQLEAQAKVHVRIRDKTCRFPRCGCQRRAFRLRLEVAHIEHKGAGGNPDGTRSTEGGMVLLCSHRHQHGAVSLHKGTLKVHFLSRRMFNGPVAWLLNRGPDSVWRELARESRPGVLEPLTEWQERMLETLAQLEL
jgi:hypothetical protein